MDHQQRIAGSSGSKIKSLIFYCCQQLFVWKTCREYHVLPLYSNSSHVTQKWRRHLLFSCSEGCVAWYGTLKSTRLISQIQWHWEIITLYRNLLAGTTSVNAWVGLVVGPLKTSSLLISPLLWLHSFANSTSEPPCSISVFSFFISSANFSRCTYDLWISEYASHMIGKNSTKSVKFVFRTITIMEQILETLCLYAT